jgi:hypothetical protein
LSENKGIIIEREVVTMIEEVYDCLKKFGFTRELMCIFHSQWFKILNENGIKNYKW